MSRRRWLDAVRGPRSASHPRRRRVPSGAEKASSTDSCSSRPEVRGRGSSTSVDLRSPRARRPPAAPEAQGQIHPRLCPAPSSTKTEALEISALLSPWLSSWPSPSGCPREPRQVRLTRSTDPSRRRCARTSSGVPPRRRSHPPQRRGPCRRCGPRGPSARHRSTTKPCSRRREGFPCALAVDVRGCSPTVGSSRT